MQKRPPRIGSPFTTPEKAQENMSAGHSLDKLLHSLNHAVDRLAVWTAPYEYSQPFTIGGPAGSGPYRIQSPFDSWAEYCISQVSFVGAGPFQASLGSSAPPPLPSATLVQNDHSGRDMIAYSNATAANIPQLELWYPLPAYQALFWVVSAVGAGFVTVQFRRRVNPAGIPAATNT